MSQSAIKSAVVRDITTLQPYSLCYAYQDSGSHSLLFALRVCMFMFCVLNIVIPNKLGIIGVVNRSQLDIKNRKVRDWFGACVKNIKVFSIQSMGQ